MTDSQWACGSTCSQRKPDGTMLYVAGPYTAPTRFGTELNIARAVEAWCRLTEAGFLALCPHVATERLAVAMNLPPAYWYDYTLALMRRCDAVVLVPDGLGTPIAASTGTAGEIAEAKRLGMPVYTLADLIGGSDEATPRP